MLVCRTLYSKLYVITIHLDKIVFSKGILINQLRLRNFIVLTQSYMQITDHYARIAVCYSVVFS